MWKRSYKPIGVVSAAVLALTALIAAPAPAAAVSADSVPISSGQVKVYDPAMGMSRHVGTAEAERILDAYWTPERRAAAQPVVAPPEKPGIQRKRPVAPGAPEIGSMPALPVVPSDSVSVSVNFTHAVGKIFLRDPVTGKDGECSGATINTPKQRIVLTAAHCVHGGPGGRWMENWVFYPGYSNGEGPAGRFPAWQLWSMSGWRNNGDHHYDYAFAITQTNQSGQKVVARVGGNGIIYNPGRPFVTAFGYPGDIANGEQQLFCQGTLSRRSITNSDQKLGCSFGKGASGGPMIKDYDSTFPRLGWAVSDISYRLETGGPVFGPYFDDDTKTLRNAAENASP